MFLSIKLRFLFFKGDKMEFLELLLVLIALVLILAKPEKEKLAFGLVMVSWAIMIFYYVGHKSSAFLTIMNL